MFFSSSLEFLNLKKYNSGDIWLSESNKLLYTFFPGYFKTSSKFFLKQL